MMGGYFDNHPWGIFEGRVVVDAPDFPAMRHFAPVLHQARRVLRAAREAVLARARCACSRISTRRTSISRIPNYHRKDADLPVALARTYGKGRTFWSNFGHFAETWDDPDIQKMYLEAIKWAMGLTPGDAAPRPVPRQADDAEQTPSARESREDAGGPRH